MIASCKAVRPRSLSNGSLTKKNAEAWAPEGLPYTLRAFSWGAKSKWGPPHAGKVYKGFYTRQADAQIRRSKKYPSLGELDRSYLGMRRLRSNHAWRAASSWRKSEEHLSSVADRSNTDEGEDWYGRWERQKMRQYNEFVRKIEQDPYQALFGASNRWLGWLNATHSSSKRPENPQARSYAKDSFTRAEDSIRSTNPGKTSTNVGEAQPPRIDESRSPPSEEQDYEIDPITLRKVPKETSKPDSGIKSRLSKTDEKTASIPIKKFDGSGRAVGFSISSTSSAPRPEASFDQTPQDWLSQEGFRARKIQIDTDGGMGFVSKAVRAEGSKIESALDRHIKSNDSALTQLRNPTAHYKSKETTRDDIDLLRASDITASAGSASRMVKETPPVNEPRQRILEKQYEQRSSEMDDRLAKEVADRKSGPASDHQTIASSANVLSDPEDLPSTACPVKLVSAQTGSNLTSTHVSRTRAKLVPLKAKIDLLKVDYDGLRRKLLEEKRRMEGIAKKRAARKAGEMLDQEVKAQQAAMYAVEVRHSEDFEEHKPTVTVSHEELHGEGDMASNVHEFAGRARWYKRKAPHAQCKMDAKLQELASEKAFVSEIRGIYEDTYGTIDTEHRQPYTAQRDTKMADSSNEGTTDPQLLNIITQDWGERLEHGVKEILPIEKEMAHELRSLAFTMEDCRQRASGETDQQRKDLIMKEAIDAASESGTRVISAGLRLALFHGPLDANALRRSLIAAARFAGIDLASDLSPSTSTPTAAVAQSLHESPAAEVSSEPSTKTYYRILAYDSSLQKVSSAKTSSQTPFVGEKPLSPLQALNQLQNPGKFLPHLISLHNKGYDIISGANDILMLKKVREAVISKDDYYGRPNPVDGTTTPEVSTGNFASPTGFVNHNPVLPPDEEEPQQSVPHRATDKVRREEDVFSGTTRRTWQEGKRSSKKDKRKLRRRRTIRRMLLTGTMTAVACYATGVVFEMMHM